MRWMFFTLALVACALLALLSLGMLCVVVQMQYQGGRVRNNSQILLADNTNTSSQVLLAGYTPTNKFRMKDFCPRPDCHCEGTGICTVQRNCMKLKRSGRWLMRQDGEAIFCSGKPYYVYTDGGFALRVDGCAPYNETFELRTN